MSLPDEVKAKYVTIIDEILESSDLAQITEKRIRNGIQDKVEYDILPQKAAIKELIMQRFDVFNSKQNGHQEPVNSIEVPDFAIPVPVNGHNRTESPSVGVSTKREAEESDFSDVRDSPPKKRRKEGVVDDAALAAKLQAEENRNARATRGVATRKVAPKKSRAPKKKKKSKITASDDSDVEEGSSPKKPKSNTGFNKPLTLTPIAADFFGTPEISRPQATKALWEHIRAHGLQDPADKRFIICDEKLKTLLKSDRISMFHMPKNLNAHFVPDE